MAVTLADLDRLPYCRILANQRNHSKG
ncbi:hypothetical protein CCACVL1_16067 [Corchorus capsularis]|uniref:Uncharacterized protein n=1 Tax=Corchorus capsularis TaxID=210143 RepID=A0A1R3HZF5_COCAP|nr:hypothetical protein CCACVL1_16067 [Corchorus capsularis]